jgi:hypothetical protein
MFKLILKTGSFISFRLMCISLGIEAALRRVYEAGC